MKLFTIGDSLSQGVMSGATARTDLCFATRIAQIWNLKDYRIPHWPEGGVPINLERIMRHLVHHFGAEIRGLEWLTVLKRIKEVLDKTEDYYERGPAIEPYAEGVTFFHNVSNRGFGVADSWQIDAAFCRRKLKEVSQKNHFFGLPEASFYRAAARVLNPSHDPAFEEFSQLKWLDYHCRNEGVANTIVWLGANNALGTILNLKINLSEDVPGLPFEQVERNQRQGWNLWLPHHFKADYETMFAKVIAAMAANRDPNWRVFVATIPHVTIAPLAKGVGEPIDFGGRGWYFNYYTYFPFGVHFAKKTGRHLNLREALFIDDVIDQYNRIIVRAAVAANRRFQKLGHPRRFFVVDIAKGLRRLAWKRNGGKPTYSLPKALAGREPIISAGYYHADRDGRVLQGGVFSLDGVHPSATGHGLIANEFLEVMREAGVPQALEYREDDLPWLDILTSDALLSQPITLMGDLYRHERLATLFVRLCQFLNVDQYSPDRWHF